MQKTFIPTEYLNNSELEVLKQTKQKITKAKTQKELNYYELVLDLLMTHSFERYKSNKN